MSDRFKLCSWTMYQIAGIPLQLGNILGLCGGQPLLANLERKEQDYF